MKSFRSHLRNSQYSSKDFIITSIGINFLLYSATIIGLRERLVRSTMLRSAEGQRMIPMLGFSFSRFTSLSRASKYKILPTNSGWWSIVFSSIATKHCCDC